MRLMPGSFGRGAFLLPDALITEQVTAGATPGSVTARIAPTAGQTATIAARADQEYVAGSYPIALQNYLRTLPHWVDDLTAEFGDDLYERMLLDPHVAAEITVLKASILETGVSLAPAKPDQADDGHDLSVTIRDAAERMFDELRTPLDDALWNMADAIALGNKVAELTYRQDTTITGRSALVLDKIAVKPRRATAFVVDAYNNVPGLLALIPGVNSTLQAGMTLGDLTTLPNFLPREKFAIWSYRPKDGNPRGTPLLRPIHNPWWLKQQLWGEYLKYLTQFASPSVAGFTAQGAQAVPDPANPGAVLTPQQAMQAAIEQLRNGAAATFPYGAALHVLQAAGEGQAFLAAFALLNREITKGILTQALATEEGQHQARSASQVHKDVLDTLVRQGKRSLVRMISFDILRPWIRLNWGDAAMQLVPVVSLGSTENEDFASEANAIALLQRYGYLDESQFDALDQRLGLPPRDPEWQEQPKPAVVALRPSPAAALQGQAAAEDPLKQPVQQAAAA